MQVQAASSLAPAAVTTKPASPTPAQPPTQAPAAATDSANVSAAAQRGPALRRISFADGAKIAGAAAGGAVAGTLATSVVDLFFHFGNNGGTSYPGAVYKAAAVVGAGAAAYFLYKKLCD